MALNTNLPLMVRPMELQGPMQSAQQALTLKDLMAGAAAREAQRDHYRQAQAGAAAQAQNRQAFFQMFRANGGRMTPELAAIGGQAGISPTDMQAYAGVDEWGRPKVASWQEVAGPGGAPAAQAFDAFGKPIGDARAKSVKPDVINTGGRQVGIRPYSGEQVFAIENTASPEAVLTDQRARSEGAKNRAVTIRGQDLTDARAAAKAEWEQRQEAQFGGAKAFEAENKIRDDYLKQSGEFIKVRDAYTRVKASGVSPSAAGDLAMIFNYMKMLDPGSVVREGEFATAQNSGGVPDQVRSMYNQAINGQRLTDNIRNDFLARAEKLYRVAQKDHGAIKFQFQRIAKDYGLNADRVTPNFDSADLDIVGLPAAGQAEDLSQYYTAQ